MTQHTDTDSPGFDICRVHGTSVQQMYDICKHMPHAVAFNTWGYIKYHLANKLVPSSGTTLYLIDRPEPPVSHHLGIPMPQKWCINLKRRPDRRESMMAKMPDIHFFEAFDGKELSMTDEIRAMFCNSDFGFRRSVIGCCLSHITLWKQLLASDQESYLILEDDIEIADDFDRKLRCALDQLKDKEYDMLNLGFTIINSKKKNIVGDLWNAREPRVLPFDNSFFGAGFFGYLLTRRGAQKMLDIVEKKGVPYAVDCFPTRFRHIERYTTLPHLVQTPYVGPGSGHTDSDIQLDHDVIPDN